VDVFGWIIVFAIVFFIFQVKKKPKSNRYKRPPRAPWKEPARKQEPTFTGTASAQPQPQQPQQAPQSAQPSRKIAADGFRYDPEGEWPFQKRKLITATETVLFERMRQALPDHYIFTQVQLSQLVAIKKGHSFKMWFSRISQMSVDFVIADEFLNTVAAVELDDKSHYSDEDRHKADAKKDKVLTAAGIRVVRWRCEIMPSVEQIALTFPECKRTPEPQPQRAVPTPAAEPVIEPSANVERIEPTFERPVQVEPRSPSQPG